MIFERSYMRTPQPQSTQSSNSFTMYLLIGTIVVYLLQQIVNVCFPGTPGEGFNNWFFYNWFALSSAHFQDLKVWTILTYAFMHSTQTILHIIGNMFGLFFLGRLLEPQLGSEKFLALYVGGIIAGGCVYLLLHLNGSVGVIGASAAISALLAVFCLQYPDRPITILLFFVIPVTLKPRLLLQLAIIVSLAGLFFYELRAGHRGIAHSAHLGGLGFGYLFFRYADRVTFPKFSNKIPTLIEPPKWFKRFQKNKTSTPYSYSVNRSSTKQEAVDKILDKINTHGFEALSKKEKDILHRAKESLR